MAMLSTPKGQYLTFRAESRDVYQGFKSSKFSHGVRGGGFTNQTCAQIDGRPDKWQSLHPVIHTESFEVKPEGRRADRLEQRS